MRIREAPLTQRLLCAALALFSTSGAAGARELKVVATIKPIHALVSRVMAGVGTPALLLSGAQSPHTYALKPSDARALHAADVFFRVSPAVEPFTVKIARSLPATVRVVTLAEAPGLELLSRRTGGTFEAHRHDDDNNNHDNHDHEPGDHAPHEERVETSSRDGHVWLDPENAKMMAAEIARVLAERSPEHAATLKQNAERLTLELNSLEADIARELEPAKGKPFIVFHDAYQYFERRYGLAAAGSITISPEVKPSAKRLTEIRGKIAALGAVCVFAEPQFQPRLIEAVVEGTQARSGTLDPEGVLIAPGPEAYATLLKGLADGLKSCLVQGS